MKKQFSKLIDLKSLITLALTIALVAIVFSGTSINDEGIRTLFVSVTSSVFTYYFSRKEKTGKGDTDNGDDT